MSYSQHFFGKKLDEITEQDLIEYFADPKEETDRIEFKAGIDKKTEKQIHIDVVLKSLTAFLNSAGGLLIWGAPIGEKKGDKKVFQGPLVPLPDYDRDKVIGGSIANTIEPLPSGLRSHPVDVSGGVVVIFDIPSSDYKPHRFKHVFYMRIDGSTHKAPYHFVEALFKRVNYAETRGVIEFESNNFPMSKGASSVSSLFNVVLTNESLFRNDEDVFFLVHLNGTLILNSRTNALIKVPKILHYGLPSICKKSIKLVIDKLHRLELLFGGKYSPLKKSVYLFTCSSDKYLPQGSRNVSLQPKVSLIFESINENIRADEWDTI